MQKEYLYKQHYMARSAAYYRLACFGSASAVGPLFVSLYFSTISFEWNDIWGFKVDIWGVQLDSV